MASSPPAQQSKDADEHQSITITAQVYTQSSTVQTNSNTCIVEEVEEKTECGTTITITSSRRPSTNSASAIQTQTIECVPEPVQTVSSPPTQALLSINNLETYLCKYSVLFDSKLFLNLLLHKLTWDLGLAQTRLVYKIHKNSAYLVSVGVLKLVVSQIGRQVIIVLTLLAPSDRHSIDKRVLA